ncbi:four-helix bundle copper-binding protein [Aeromicrobium sp.]|uniref:four-helix bundle copper-binding protein n=1 Tax=Aeromicrobium sp. TaxID=1871063 RepID=UPI0028A6E2CE|nr:four-helix bundle copper-binding protein [Aeromicrobium sp.]
MTHRTAEFIDAHPGAIGLDRDLLATCIAACLECAQACTACADACLAEDMVADLRSCITTDLNCADLCAATARVLSRHTGYDADVTRATLQACLTACRSCGDECASHADMHDHCRLCAEACRACAKACEELLASLG